MAKWEPVDVSPFNHDDIEDVYGQWDGDLKSNLELRFNKLMGFKKTLNESTDEEHYRNDRES